MESKAEATEKAPAKTNISELHLFLGLLNYYGKFVTNLSTLLHSLHRLLQTTENWHWTLQCEQAFNAGKQHLLSG